MSSRPSPLAPRGPLPAAVYWRRRLLVLAVALVVVLVILRLALGGGDEEPEARAALSAADATAPSETSAEAEEAPAVTAAGRQPRAEDRERAAQPAAPVLAEPSGPCQPRDVSVTPEVGTAIAGPDHGVDLVLSLRTLTADACTWAVSPRTLSVKITSGADDIWFSQHCPAAITRQEVVVRRAVSTTITVPWNARRSDEDCSAQTAWAMPGFYHVSAAALAGEPAKAQFELLAPSQTAGRPLVPSRTPAGETGQDEQEQDAPEGDAAADRG